MTDLLPHNAAPQERALSLATARLSDVPVPIRETWNPDTCPPNLLAWLAWAFSVDQWDNNWTDAQKRELIKRSVEIHRTKGTIGAVREALGALGIDVRVQEWFNQTPAGDPYTFGVLLEVDQVGIVQSLQAALFKIIDRTKNLRSHMTQVELTVHSAGGPQLAVVASLGSEICLTNYTAPSLVINEHVIVI